jgi:hypothetical protein
MERKAAITTAAAITVTLLAGGTAMAANLGILDSEPASGLGETSPVSTPAGPSATAPPQVETIIVDETVPGGPGATNGATGAGATPGATAAPGVSAPSTSPVTSDDDTADFDDSDDDATEYEDHGEAEDEHEDEDEHEYEGAEDDD